MRSLRLQYIILKRMIINPTGQVDKKFYIILRNFLKSDPKLKIFQINFFCWMDINHFSFYRADIRTN